MHEMGIASEIVRIAVESIPEEMAGSRVVRVHLRVGKLAAVVSESLRFCFDVVAKETPAEGAELAIQQVAVVAQCNECDHRWEIENTVFSCPRCASGSIEMISGREMDIDSIELEQE